MLANVCLILANQLVPILWLRFQMMELTNDSIHALKAMMWPFGKFSIVVEKKVSYSIYFDFNSAKVRDGDQRRVQLNDGDVAARNVLIVDDLVRSGGTLIEW